MMRAVETRTGPVVIEELQDRLQSTMLQGRRLVLAPSAYKLNLLKETAERGVELREGTSSAG